MLHLLAEKIAVIPLKDPGKIGSLFVPEKSKRAVDQGIVKYIGRDVEDIVIGDHVYFTSYRGSWVTIEGEGDLVILPQELVIAIQGEGPPRTHCATCGAYLLGRMEGAAPPDYREGGDTREEGRVVVANLGDED